MESLQTGSGGTRGDSNEIAADLANSPKSKSEAFRLGAMYALQESMQAAQETANAAHNVMRSPKRKRLIRMTLSGKNANADFEKFMANQSRESGMARVKQAGTNSATAQRQKLNRDLTGAVKAAAMPTNPSQLLDNQLRPLGDENTRLGKRAAGDELAHMMTTKSPAELQRIQRRIMSGFDPREVAMNKLLNPISTPVFALGRVASDPLVIGQTAGTLRSDLGFDLSGVPSRIGLGLNDEQKVLSR